MENLVKQLVEKRKEGTWWDFKREHHEHSVDLLHDILCLSNAIHPGDRYLIIGVSDTYDFVDVKNGKTRRTQADIIDLLKTKSFSEDNIPTVSMESISIGGNEIDIIAIKNERNKPYYLLRDERKGKRHLRLGVVYSRVEDTNTPIDRCANPKDVELMWRERFGLTLSAEERFKHILLECDNWRYDGMNKAYYSKDPDYSIEIEKDNDSEGGGQYWWQSKLVEKAIGTAYVLRYRGVDIYRLPVQRFCSENLCFPFPHIEFIAYPDDEKTEVPCYCDLFYYTKDSIEYSLFYHIRTLEVGGKTSDKSFKTPIETQIKPPIISLPFLVFENAQELNEAVEKLRGDLGDFITKGIQIDDCDQRSCEELFTEWAHHKIMES